MRFTEINAIKSVKDMSPIGKPARWEGDTPYPLTIDAEAVTVIEPYRGEANANTPEVIVPGFFTMTLAGGQVFTIDDTARKVIVDAKNAA